MHKSLKAFSVFQPPGVLGAMKAVEHEHTWRLWLTGGGRELLRALQELQEAAAAPSGSISLLITLTY